MYDTIKINNKSWLIAFVIMLSSVITNAQPQSEWTRKDWRKSLFNGESIEKYLDVRWKASPFIVSDSSIRNMIHSYITSDINGTPPKTRTETLGGEYGYYVLKYDAGCLDFWNDGGKYCQPSTSHSIWMYLSGSTMEKGKYMLYPYHYTYINGKLVFLDTDLSDVSIPGLTKASGRAKRVFKLAKPAFSKQFGGRTLIYEGKKFRFLRKITAPVADLMFGGYLLMYLNANGEIEASWTEDP
ncbi:MAG: hypothetical protein JXQ90_06955 [Cyclobacteriaceae bacterium]